MDDLLKEFLREASEPIDATSAALLRFEKDQADPALIARLFRHIHTIKGSSGFLGLPRVARLTHAIETLIGRLRDGAKATPAQASLILAAVDRLDRRFSKLLSRYRRDDGFLSILDVGAMPRRVAKLSEAALRDGRPIIARRGVNP
jgi:two-component system chemotaxis sensor kinase CheA